jgi:hypothetical protein
VRQAFAPPAMTGRRRSGPARELLSTPDRFRTLRGRSQRADRPMPARIALTNQTKRTDLANDPPGRGGFKRLSRSEPSRRGGDRQHSKGM